MDPLLFINAGIFIVNSDLLPNSTLNQFYKITDETIGVHVNEEIMIGGKTVKLLNVMACNKNWLLRSYYNPLNTIDRMISEKRNMRYQGSVLTTQSAMISKPHAPVIYEKFRTQPISTTCRFCQCHIITSTETKFNCLACFCFLLTNILYICVQLCADNNICCCDVIHRCPNCGRVLGKYTSC